MDLYSLSCLPFDTIVFAAGVLCLPNKLLILKFLSQRVLLGKLKPRLISYPLLYRSHAFTKTSDLKHHYLQLQVLEFAACSYSFRGPPNFVWSDVSIFDSDIMDGSNN